MAGILYRSQVKRKTISNFKDCGKQATGMIVLEHECYFPFHPIEQTFYGPEDSMSGVRELTQISLIITRSENFSATTFLEASYHKGPVSQRA